MTIRVATLADEPAIGRLAALVHRATYAPLLDVPYGTPPAIDWAGRIAGPGVTLVAVDLDIVGIAHAAGDRIETLYVAPSHQRRGHGTALLRQLLDRLGDRAIVRFNVLARNEAAIAFYEAQGARRVGSVRMTDAPVPYWDLLFELPTT